MAWVGMVNRKGHSERPKVHGESFVAYPTDAGELEPGGLPDERNYRLEVAFNVIDCAV